MLDANDPENASYVRTLDTLLLDMAYDKTSDTLYGVDAGSKVYTIDRYSGELTLVGSAFRSRPERLPAMTAAISTMHLPRQITATIRFTACRLRQ